MEKTFTNKVNAMLGKCLKEGLCRPKKAATLAESVQYRRAKYFQAPGSVAQPVPGGRKGTLGSTRPLAMSRRCSSSSVAEAFLHQAGATAGSSGLAGPRPPGSREERRRRLARHLPPRPALTGACPDDTAGYVLACSTLEHLLRRPCPGVLPLLSATLLV